MEQKLNAQLRDKSSEDSALIGTYRKVGVRKFLIVLIVHATCPSETPSPTTVNTSKSSLTEPERSSLAILALCMDPAEPFFSLGELRQS